MQNPKRSRCQTITGSLLALTLGVGMSLAPPAQARAAPTPSQPPTTAAGSPTPTPSPAETAKPGKSPASTAPSGGSTSSAPSPNASASPGPSSLPTPETSPTTEQKTRQVAPNAAGRAAAETMNDAIAAKWKTEGGKNGYLGDVRGSQQNVDGGTYQEFQHGVIGWTSKTGAHALTGPIYDRWKALGNSTTGFPTTDISRTTSGTVRASFQKMLIVDSRYGAHLVKGRVLEKYEAEGAEKGFLGAPKTDEISNKTKRNYVSYFDGGAVTYSSAAGGHEIHGRIYTEWMDLDGPNGQLGVPVTDEYTSGKARVSRFAAGAIVHTSKTGSNAVWGALYREYSKRGLATSDLGVPRARERKIDGVWTQEFWEARLDYYRSGSRTRVHVNANVYEVKSSDVRYTYRPGCPVGPSQLKKVRMNYLGYDGRVHRGTMILRKDAVNRTVDAFSKGAWGKFALYQLSNPDKYKGVDTVQMKANNTSAFNCRKVVGNPYAQSPHSYGRAVDINTVQNPYYDGKKWYPSNGKEWIKKRTGKGVLTGKDPMTKGMTSNGYFWGAWWKDKDYQHFQIN